MRVVFYFSSNFWVNSIDFVYKFSVKEGLISGYYHDEFTATSFSYTVHQMVLCNIFALCASELISPNHIKSTPELLGYANRWTMPVSCSMLFTFLIELTWYSPEQRLSVFKSEILKVLMTIVVLNLIMLFITSWMW
jgi:hypothetical protein